MNNKVYQLMVLLIMLTAIAVRILAASYAYPTPGDALHFVQHAIAISNYGWEHMSSYWSQGMILLGVVAIKLGLDPQLFLQIISVVAGVVVVGMCMLIAHALTANRLHVIITGWLAATLPPLVHYSSIGFSEMTFMGLFLSGLYLTWLGGIKRPLLIVPGALFWGVSFYFKTADAKAGTLAVLVAACLFYRNKLLQFRWRWLCAAVIVLFTVFPQSYLSEISRYGSGSKLNNLAWGREWADSKAMAALDRPWQDRMDYLKENGTVSFLWHYKEHMTKRVLLNVIDYYRVLNELCFKYTFRLGAGWFGVFGLGCLLVLLFHGRPSVYLSLLILIGLPALAMSLFFFHERLVVPSLPFIIVLFAYAIALGLSCLLNRTAKAFVLFLVSSITLVNGYHASGYPLQATPWWEYTNRKYVADKIGTYINDGDRFMASGGAQFSLELGLSNPLVAMKLRYAPLEELDSYASDHMVRFILVSEQYRPHWPIHEVFSRAVVLPAGWEVVEDIEIPSKSWRVPDDRWLLIERLDRVNPGVD